MIDYKCERAKRLGYWNCSCRECVKRQQANTLAYKHDVTRTLRCSHGVPLKYCCKHCGDPF